MSGLFDLIKGVALLAGGAKEASMDEEKAASENRYREEDIAVKREGISSNAELAAAQRALTEKLTEREIGSREKMQEKQIDWEGKKQEAEQKFLKSENSLVRSHARELAVLRIEAEKALQTSAIKSQEGMQEKKLRQDMVIARMDESLRKIGFKLEGDKIKNDHQLGMMGVIVNSIGLSQKYTQGMEGIMTASSRMNPTMSGILNAQESANLRVIFEAIDPDGKLGLKNLNINKYVVPITPSARDAEGAAALAGKLGVTLPPPPPVSTPRIMDNVAPPVGSFAPLGGIHPGDQMGLDRVSSEIMALPDSERATAFGEYNQLINDPSNNFLGGGDPEYRKSMVRYLGKSTGFDITK